MIKDIQARNADAAAGQKEMEVLRKHFPQCFAADGAFDIEAFKGALPGGTTLIRPDEATKVSCARQFFNAMTASGYTVHFREQINSIGVKRIINDLNTAG